MEALLVKYGYVLLLAGVAVEGELFLLAASYMARQGLAFKLPLVILVALIANCGASQVYYQLARSRGRAWLQGRFGDNRRYRKVVELMARHGSWVLFGSRYAFGFRIIIPAACGALDMPPLRFSIINIFAGVIWALPVSAVGYYLGSVGEALLLSSRKYQLWIVVSLLAAAAAVLLVRHFRHTEWIEDLKEADIHTFVPPLVGILGAINLLEAIVPRDPAAMRALRSYLPLELTQLSRPLLLFAGISLLQVWRNLARRKELSWYASTAALSTSLVLHITRGFDLHHSLLASLLLIYLVHNRRRFYARSSPMKPSGTLLMVSLVAAAVVAYGYVGLTVNYAHFSWSASSTPFKEAVRAGLLILQPPITPATDHAMLYLSSLHLAGWLGRIYVLFLLLRPLILRDRKEAPRAQIDDIFVRCGRQSLSALAVQGDKHHLLVADGNGFVAYAARGTVALACGDPVAPQKRMERAISEYMAFCRKNGWTACVFDAAEDNIPLYLTLGFSSLKMADEAILPLVGFSLTGSSMANLRAMVHKAGRAGAKVERYDRTFKRDPLLDEQLEEVSEEWLSEKHLAELGFTIGRFSLESLKGIPVFVCFVGERLEAFCSWIPYRNGSAAVLDIMRKRRNAPPGTMDFLLAHSLLHLRADGLVEASLSNAPVADISASHARLEPGIAQLYENVNAFYGYKNLFRFKSKFGPRWEGRYLIYPKGADLLRVADALTGVHSSKGLLQLLRRR